MSALLVHLSAWYLPAIYIATALASTRLAMPQARAEWTRNGFVLIVVQLVFLALNSPRAAGCVTVLMAVWAAWFLVRSARVRKRLERAWLFLDAGKHREGVPAIAPVVFAPPFTGRWRAVTGGSDPARNHHFGARPQWFAYDFLREDGATLGSKILAPCDGIVVGTETTLPDKKPQRWFSKNASRNPAGNFVLIQVDGRSDVYVALAHLQRGSVQVEVGDRVKPGQLVGRCGNSGNTTAPHLHMHAQYVPPDKLNAKGSAEPMQWKAMPVPLRLLQEGAAVRIRLGEPLAGHSGGLG
jgi:murein DD-endopeptidase MepM/ murein hydrolase activator NlpD